MYVVGTQECQSEIVASLHSPQKSEWEAKICGTIGSRYCLVASETMGPFMLLHSSTFAFFNHLSTTTSALLELVLTID